MRRCDWPMRLTKATVVLVRMAIAAEAAVLAGGCQRAPLPTSREGRALYAENGCANCHGDKGYGDGVVAATLDPRPRDFRDVAAFKNGFDVAAIATTLATGMLVDAPGAPRESGASTHHQEGTPYFSGTLGEATAAPRESGASTHHQQGMPRFSHLSDVERQSLALYVMSLRGSSR